MDIESTSAYDPELVSLLIAQEIAGDRLVTAWSDCSAAIKCVMSGNLGRYAQVLSGWKRKRNIKICKVDSHPEHRKVPNEWTVEEKGNFIADRVAGGAVEARLTIKASQWLRFIGSRSKIIVTDQDGLPVITDPRVIKSRTDRKQYLRTRDHYREKDLKPPCWEGANLALHHRLMGRSNKIGDRVITQRIGLLKRWQWHAARSDNVCAGCQAPIKDISHPLRHCSHIEMVEARDSWWKEVEVAIMHSRISLRERLFSITRKMREVDGGLEACCGSFQVRFVTSLGLDDVPLSDRESKHLIRVLKKVTGGARKMLRIAAEIQLGLCGVNWRQTSIPHFFKPVEKRTKVKVRRVWADPPPPTNPPPLKSKNKKCNSKIALQNKDINIHHICDSYTRDDMSVYWEFKAG
jgi:hypothetical protein